MNDTSLNCGMRNAECGVDAPGARILPRTGSMLLYTLTAANARVAMAESTFGRGLSAGDEQPLLVTGVDTFGDVVHLVGVVITARGVNLPVDGVPLVRGPTPGAAHWPLPDGSLVAALEERAEPRNDVPLKQRSGQTGMSAPDSLPCTVEAMTPPVHSVSVKVMRSHDYCHFEVCLSSTGAATLEGADALRKEAARLADKAVAQYKTAKAAAEVLGEMRSKSQLSWAERTPEGQRTPTQKAIIKFHQDAAFAARFNYDYEDGYEPPTPEDLDEEE